MFSDTRRKRMRKRAAFAAAGILVLGFGIWLNLHGTSETGDMDGAEDAVNDVKVEETAASDEADGEDAADGSSGTGTEEEPETYLIKEVDGVVKVYVCDEDGSKELYLITSIPFELLSESDQQLFIDGVTLETEDDLGEFLENFES